MWLRQSSTGTFIVGPFVDNTDGATPETGITIAQADVRLSKNGSVFAQKNEATSATYVEAGYYSVPYNAIDTNTLGTLKLAINITGTALPVWADFMVLPSNVFNSIVWNTEVLRVNALNTGTVSTIANYIGIPVALDGGTGTIAGMLTKFADDSNGTLFDATSDSLKALSNTVNNISIVGSPSYEAPSSYVLSTGTQSAGTYSNVDTSNAVYHEHTDSGGLLDLYYEYILSADEIAVSVLFKGRITGINDSVNIQAYNWIGNVWVTFHTLAGTSGSTDTTLSSALVSKYTGTGTNVGKVRIRFVNAVTLSTATLYVDQLIVGKTITNRTVGYQDGAVWISASGTAGTASYVNGTADNPVSNIADAYVIAAAVGLTAFNIAQGTTVTLTQPANGWLFEGQGRINLNGQSIADSTFKDSYTISGISTGDDVFFENCGIGDVTVYHSYFNRCRMKGTLTMVASQNYFLDRCYDANESASIQTIVFAANSTAMIRDWRGGIQLNSMGATNECIIDGAGRVVIDGSSVGGSITIRGHFSEATGASAFLLAGGTISDSARMAEDQNIYAVTSGYMSVTGTVVSSSVTGNIGGNVLGTVNSVVDGYVSVSGTVNSNIVSSDNIDFTALQKTSLNSATPTSVGSVTGNVVGSVGSVVSPVTVVGYVNVTGTVQAVVVGYVQVSGTVDANVEKWNTVDVVSGAIPAFTAGAAGGLPTVDLNNYVAGIQGTKNQLDDLNDIAAGAQMDLVNAPNATALNAIADAQLIRDWTAVAGVVPSRSQLNALRFLRNKWSVAGGVLTVTKEDDATSAWTGVVTSDVTANNITAVDPA